MAFWYLFTYSTMSINGFISNLLLYFLRSDMVAGQKKEIEDDDNNEGEKANKTAVRFKGVDPLFGNRALAFGKMNEKKHAKMLRRPKLQTNRPIIGVLAQSIHPTETNHPSYIAASFVKCLESSGARVVPIMNDLTEGEIEKLFFCINGVFFPGGVVNLVSSGYAKVGRVIYNLAMKSFDEGDYFPLWGACLGFQFLAVLASDDVNICSRTDSHNLSLPLEFSHDYFESSMFRDIPQDLAEYLRIAPTTYHAHHWSVTVDSYERNKDMKQLFKVVSTNHDRKGTEFVSTMEGRRYPFYATQWHPEKCPFEWMVNRDMPHDAMSIKVAQYMSNFFVNEARYSKHKFKTVEEEQDALIYHFSTVYTGKKSIYEQVYLFNSTNPVDDAERLTLALLNDR